MNLKDDKQQNIQMKLDFSSGLTGEPREAGREETESAGAMNGTESPASTNRWMEEVCERENLKAALKQVKAKAEPAWRFWGLYVHVCKRETLQEAYQMAKSNDGAPGIDGVTFEAIEESGAESFLKQIQDELVHNTYQPMRVRKKEIPKDGGYQGPRSFDSQYS